MRTIILISVIFVVAIIVTLCIQLFQIGVYHDGRCGAQKWERHLLWMDFGEPDYDEYGIEERWIEAHRVPCKHIWIKGPLEQDSGAYWPPLHLAIAEGRPLPQIRHQIAQANRQTLFKKDRLGRTIMHWLVIHPDVRGSKLLIDELVRRGLNLDGRDSNGLSPRDWQANFQHAKTTEPQPTR